MTTDARPTPTGAELLALMQTHGITPRVDLSMPGSTIMLPPPHQAEWEAAHGGKPVLSSVMAGLENRGLVVGYENKIAGRRYRWWGFA